MTERSILITGCSSGIGYDAAHRLKREGWRVLATCRAARDTERLNAEGLESFVLDYADEASVLAGAEEALSRTSGTLGALFNNGAFAQPGAVSDLPRAALRASFETNLFGPFQLANALIPAMAANGGGRIINCSSVLGLVALRMRGAYNATKFAMEGLTDTARLEHAGESIRFILIEPGPITSDIRRNSVPHFERWIDWKGSLHRTLYENAVLPRLYKESGTPDRFELPASAVSDALLRALNAKNPAPRYYVTKPTYMMGFLRRALPTRLLDRVLMRA